MANDRIRGDRRVQRRYPLELDLEYRVMDRHGIVSSGEGKTDNLSSGGVRFRTAQPVDKGVVELSIRWPAVLGNLPFIELHISGQVIRSDETGTAVRLSQYHFQQIGNPAEAFYNLFGHSLIQ